MNFNFELIIFYATLVCGIIALYDVIFLAPKRKAAGVPSDKLPFLSDYARAFFPVLLIVFLLRSFLYEPFRIPSGSLKPTLMVGDFILVNKFDYGIRIPVIHKKIYPLAEPKHGDIIVFRYPLNPSVDYIKRVIGVPGDHVSYIDKILYVNGKEMPQQFVKNTTDRTEEGEILNVVQKEENFFGIKHAIYQNPDRLREDVQDFVVPEGMYFVMGDNRDNSTDSRYWGFVPEENIIGKAGLVWMGWDSDATWPHKINGHRIGTIIR